MENPGLDTYIIGIHELVRKIKKDFPEKMVIALKALCEKAGREKGQQPITVSIGQSTCKDPEAAWSSGKPRPKGGQVRLEQRTMGTVLQEQTRGQATQSFVGHFEKFCLYLPSHGKLSKVFN